MTTQTTATRTLTVRDLLTAQNDVDAGTLYFDADGIIWDAGTLINEWQGQEWGPGMLDHEAAWDVNSIRLLNTDGYMGKTVLTALSDEEQQVMWQAMESGATEIETQADLQRLMES